MVRPHALASCMLVSALLAMVLWDYTDAFRSTRCQRCKEVVIGFEKGEKKTSRDNFGGGDVHWEEKKRVAYADSETRLVEILESSCEKGSHECTSMLEETEELIEKWWFKKRQKYPHLEDWLCRIRLKVCCRKNEFGKNCTACPGGADNPCSGHGNCDGAGERTGSGRCSCGYGYTGDACENCEPGFFFEPKIKECLNCHRACVENCTGALPVHCKDCKLGWQKLEEGGCADLDECSVPPEPRDDDESESSRRRCPPEQYCVNTDGSFECNLCHGSCYECTGDGQQACASCSMGYRWNETTSLCEDVDECEDGVVISDDDDDDDDDSEDAKTVGKSKENVAGAQRQPACDADVEICVNSVGTYTCLCKKGFSRRDSTCQPDADDKGSAETTADRPAGGNEDDTPPISPDSSPQTPSAEELAGAKDEL